MCPHHHRDFLNTVTTDIIHLHDNKLHAYKGNFAQFEEMYEQRRREVRAVRLCLLLRASFTFVRGPSYACVPACMRVCMPACSPSLLIQSSVAS